MESLKTLSAVQAGKMKRFNIATKDGLKQVEAEEVNILQHKCFVREETLTALLDGYPSFVVTEFSTGMSVCFDMTKEAAIDKAKKLFSEHNEASWMKNARGHLQYANIEYPVNVESKSK